MDFKGRQAERRLLRQGRALPLPGRVVHAQVRRQRHRPLGRRQGLAVGRRQDSATGDDGTVSVNGAKAQSASVDRDLRRRRSRSRLGDKASTHHEHDRAAAASCRRDSDDPRRRGRELDRVVRLALPEERRATPSRRPRPAREALAQVAAQEPALIVLDLMLPDIDGIEVCKRVRQHSDVPILMLTARDEDVDKIIGLEVGADDYLTKPFNPRELVARIRSILRRATPERRDRESEVIVHGDLASTPAAARSRVGDEEIQLAPKEFDLLWELLDHRGLVLTRDQLLERVWGYTFAGDTRTVDVHVRQLRRKLGDASPIVTVWGVGYKVSPAEDQQKDPATRLGRGPRALVASRPAAAALPRRDRPRRASSRPRSRSGCSRTSRTTRPSPSSGARRTASRGSTRTPSRASTYEQQPAPGADVRGARTSSARPATASATSACAPFPGEKSGLQASCGLDDAIDWTSGETLTFEFTPPGASRHLPRGRGAGPPRQASRSARSSSRSRRRTSPTACAQLVARLAVAGALGLLVAGLLAWYLSRRDRARRCSRSRAAADEVAGGNYDVESPERGARRDRPPGRALRRDGRTASPRRRRASGTSSCRSRTSCARR